MACDKGGDWSDVSPRQAKECRGLLATPEAEESMTENRPSAERERGRGRERRREEH